MAIRMGKVLRGDASEPWHATAPTVNAPPPYAAAQPSDSTSACSKTVSVAFSCLSGG